MTVQYVIDGAVGVVTLAKPPHNLLDDRGRSHEDHRWHQDPGERGGTARLGRLHGRLSMRI